MAITSLLFIFFVQGLLGLQAAYAATYYVSPSGSDTNNGTTLSTAVKTINKAVSKAVNSGDIVYVMTGTYNEEVTLSQSGITLSAYPGNSPIIDGGTTLPSSDWGDLIYIPGNHNTVYGFEVRNSNVNGKVKGCRAIRISGQYNLIDTVKAHHTWDSGIFIQNNYNTVQNSIVYQASLVNAIAQGNASIGIGWAAGISSQVASYTTVQNNTVYNNWGEGIILQEGDHTLAQDNISYDNWTHNLYFENTTNGLMQRNIVYNSSAPAIPQYARITRPGILLADENTGVPASANNTVINNFLYNANFNAFPWTKVANSGLNNVLIAYNTIVDGGFISCTGSCGTGFTVVNTGSSVVNNIIHDTYNDSAITSNNGISFSNNNWLSKVPSPAVSSSDIIGDPNLARTGTTAPGSLTSAYFKVAGASPVVNAGKPVTVVATDFFKHARNPINPDIGGYEY